MLRRLTAFDREDIYRPCIGLLKLNMGNTTLLLDVRYTRGLTKAYEDVTTVNANEFPIVNVDGTADDSKNSSFSLTLGVSFPIGGN